MLSKRALFGVGALAGALIFILIYGVDVLNVQNTQWLEARLSEDGGAQYLGWLAYRSSPWHGFFGLVSGVVYPSFTNIIMFDLIPLLAVFFKLLSPILPSEFQYFGLYGILCCMLQGGMGVLIVREFTEDTVACFLGGLLFLFALPLYQRLFLHHALASQWLILLAYYIFLRKDSIQGLGKNLLSWGGLLSLAAYIHLYLLPIVAVFMGFYLLEDILKERKWKEAALIWGGAIAMMVFSLLVLMGPEQLFAHSNSSGRFGHINVNLNAFFNPVDWVGVGPEEYSFYFLRKLPVIDNKTQFAGGAYLGFGVLMGCFATLTLLFARPLTEIKQYFKLRHSLIATAAFVTFVLALWPDITFNDIYLLKGLPYPGFLEFWGSSQRFVWGAVYFFYAGFIYIIIKELPPKKARLFLLFCLFVQVIDFFPTLKTYHKIAQAKFYAQADLPFDKPLWKLLPQKIKHIVFMPVDVNMFGYRLLYGKNPAKNVPWLQRLAYYAVQNQITVNEIYVNRIQFEQLALGRQKAYDAITNGTPDGGTAYIFDELPAYVMEGKLLHLYEQDGYYIGLKDPLPPSDSYKKLGPY